MTLPSSYFSCKLFFPLVLFCTLLIHSSIAPRLSSAETIEISQGVTAIASKDCIVSGGPDAGKALSAGWTIYCTRIKGDKVWVSGFITGWVRKENLVPLLAAEEYWNQRVLNEPNNSRLRIALARTQIQTLKPKAAFSTLSDENRLLKTDADCRVIVAIAKMQSAGFKEAKSEIEALCEESALSDYNAALVGANLILR